MNDIGLVEIATDTPVPLDHYTLSRDTGGFLLVERVSRDTVAAGTGAARTATGPQRRTALVHAWTATRGPRSRASGRGVLWLTGLPSAGKSTIADALERQPARPRGCTPTSWTATACAPG